MTPLARDLLTDLCSQIRIRDDAPQQQAKFLNHITRNAHFFDCPFDVWQMIMHLAASMYDAFEEYDRIDQRLAFLPAPITWIESEQPGFRDQPEYWQQKGGINKFIVADDGVSWNYTYRVAHVFISDGAITNMAQRYQVSYETPQRHPFRIWRVNSLDPLPLVHSGRKPLRYRSLKNPSGERAEFDEPVAALQDFIHYAALALINSPRIIGRKQHMPYERAERAMLKGIRMPPRFPLRAWTEIILKVALPEDRSGDKAHEAHLTGERCLHYCRSHLRVRFGLLEYVTGHWRGNPDLGVKRSRYKLERDD